MNAPRPRDVDTFFQQSPTLKQIRTTFPAEWAAVHDELDSHTSQGKPIEDYLQALNRPVLELAGKGRVKRQEALASAMAKQQIAKALLEQTALRAASGQTEGPIRFNLLSGWLIQHLLFEEDLRRKPASMLRYRLTWPLARQRHLLMPLVQPQGIYCFYSKQLIGELKRIIDNRPAVEIAAGDGTLTRFLTQTGVNITATDNNSWDTITPNPDVITEDASTTLRTRKPEVVLCSWPPAGNTFERDIFTTDTVQTYIVIASQHKFAAGNWGHNNQQTQFTIIERPDLADLVLPPELKPAVYIFQRQPSPRHD